MNAGSGVGNEFSYSWWYECNTCCAAKKKSGIWDVSEVAYNWHACRREGMHVNGIGYLLLDVREKLLLENFEENIEKYWELFG